MIHTYNRSKHDLSPGVHYRYDTVDHNSPDWFGEVLWVHGYSTSIELYEYSWGDNYDVITLRLECYCSSSCRHYWWTELETYPSTVIISVYLFIWKGITCIKIFELTGTSKLVKVIILWLRFIWS